MSVAYKNQEEFSAFSASREQLESIIRILLSSERAAQEHGEVESFIQIEGTELLRKLLQGYLDVRADTETQHINIISPAGHALKILQGKAGLVAAGMKRSVTKLKMEKKDREGIDICAT